MDDLGAVGITPSERVVPPAHARARPSPSRSSLFREVGCPARSVPPARVPDRAPPRRSRECRVPRKTAVAARSRDDVGTPPPSLTRAPSTHLPYASRSSRRSSSPRPLPTWPRASPPTSASRRLPSAATISPRSPPRPRASARRRAARPPGRLPGQRRRFRGVDARRHRRGRPRAPPSPNSPSTSSRVAPTPRPSATSVFARARNTPTSSRARNAHHAPSETRRTSWTPSPPPHTSTSRTTIPPRDTRSPPRAPQRTRRRRRRRPIPRHGLATVPHPTRFPRFAAELLLEACDEVARRAGAKTIVVHASRRSSAANLGNRVGCASRNPDPDADRDDDGDANRAEETPSFGRIVARRRTLAPVDDEKKDKKDRHDARDERRTIAPIDESEKTFAVAPHANRRTTRVDGAMRVAAAATIRALRLADEPHDALSFAAVAATIRAAFLPSVSREESFHGLVGASVGGGVADDAFLRAVESLARISPARPSKSRARRTRSTRERSRTPRRETPSSSSSREPSRHFFASRKRWTGT